MKLSVASLVALLAAVAACTSVAPSFSAERSTGDPRLVWGPLAVNDDPPVTIAAALGGAGPLEIGEECVRLKNTGRTLAWRQAQVRWDAERREIVFDDLMGRTLRISDGDWIEVGGASISGPGEARRRTWVAPPDASCPPEFEVHSLELAARAAPATVPNGTGPTTTAGTADGLFFPRHPFTLPGAAALMEGTLIEEAGCLWLSGGDGERLLLLWPPAHQAKRTARGVEVRDGIGRTVATTGTQALLGGGAFRQEHEDYLVSLIGQDIPSQCRRGRYWLATRVEEAP